jgi:hypothetical protein
MDQMVKIATLEQLQALTHKDYITKYPVDLEAEAVEKFEGDSDDYKENYYVYKNNLTLKELELQLTPQNIHEINLIGGKKDLVSFGPLKKEYNNLIEEGRWWVEAKNQ